jgi:hypothetical protein
VIKPINPFDHPEPWLLRHVVFEQSPGALRPGVVVACWPGEHMPVARIRVLADGKLWDLSPGEFDLMEQHSRGREIPVVKE